MTQADPTLAQIAARFKRFRSRKEWVCAKIIRDCDVIFARFSILAACGVFARRGCGVNSIAGERRSRHHRQYQQARQPGRWHLKTVRVHDEKRIAVNHRLAQIQNCRSTMRRRGCWCLRCSTRFSATSSVLGLKAVEMPETRRRTGPPPPLIYGISMKGLGPRFSTAGPADDHFALHNRHDRSAYGTEFMGAGLACDCPTTA
jgi:hypothetical protein